MLLASRGSVKLFLNISLALNIVFFAAFFFPSKKAYKLLDAFAVKQDSNCGMCQFDPELCEDLGEDNVQRALAYVGTNARLRRVLAKLRRGERFTVGVVGGSVSKGFGLDKDVGYFPDTPTNLNRIVFDRLNNLFPAPNGVKVGENGREENMNSYINGAVGGVGTDYFSLCYGEHLPDDMDLVFIELAINDEVLTRNINSYELLVRSLLDLPNGPAVMNFQIFALKFNTVTNGGDMHHGIAQFYDTPVLSLRNAAYNFILQNESLIPEYFYIHGNGETDTRHMGKKGHNLMGRLGAAYIETQLCEMDKFEASIPGAKSMTIDQLYPLEPIPRMQLNMKYDKDLVIPTIKPQCFLANGKKNPLVPVTNEGWRNWNWKEKHYLISDTPGSRITFKLTTTVGNIEIHYLRSYQYNLGSVKCWIDEDVDKAMRLDGYWKEPYNIGRAATVGNNLTPGEHKLTCELLKETADPSGGKEFRLISVMSI
ncbi:CAP64 gene product - related [Cryptococcus deneoformans JEC21]|uniref:CAP64 gene product-related n=2 Tax=Cryptococcus deneoformans TaxID=40410 RepID=Q5KNE2_CRYD1|nr:CAP64 gene product - related [Cryptococcus neoformans var. neoformans JEC21]AAR82902.1 Cas31p [Cryptococcus neoformans var. neoformans]AAW41092.1 CAP64 gene product - related [Cryptococcus neoformans var. neoformans JEC21]